MTDDAVLCTPHGLHYAPKWGCPHCRQGTAPRDASPPQKAKKRWFVFRVVMPHMGDHEPCTNAVQADDERKARERMRSTMDKKVAGLADTWELVNVEER